MRLWLIVLGLVISVGLPAAEPILPISEVLRIDPSAAVWKDLAAAFAREPEGKATFEEQRYFGFTTKPVVLKGESFVSASRGLSLHYTDPEERTIIIDAKGMIIRDKSGEKSVPDDPRTAAANAAMLHILRFDLAALAADFDLYGEKNDRGWRLALVPKSKTMQRAYASIGVSGDGANVSRIQLQHSARNSIEIILTKTGNPTPEEMKRYFR